MIKIEYQIEEVKPNIFAVVIPDHYDRCMTFLRAQEYYESPNKEIRGQVFSIWEYMKWYSFQDYRDGSFSYTVDWTGFNIPYEVIDECLHKHRLMSMKETPYDNVMESILFQIGRLRNNSLPAYVLGVEKLNSSTFTHELCHGMYHVNELYREIVMELNQTIPLKLYQKLHEALITAGYDSSVIDDEIQAYLVSDTWVHLFYYFTQPEKINLKL